MTLHYFTSLKLLIFCLSLTLVFITEPTSARKGKKLFRRVNYKVNGLGLLSSEDQSEIASLELFDPSREYNSFKLARRHSDEEILRRKPNGERRAGGTLRLKPPLPAKVELSSRKLLSNAGGVSSNLESSLSLWNQKHKNPFGGREVVHSSSLTL
ncbi:hypothetical protein PPACK8108_LOCUS19260 [Phakopsora pachyrhizi]|uniref:Uncharacterized protein n=1 Tax=Phakopsora pachyrhizi TaxID=170000 RepID=A0AAV0BG19_PHAPC|nr:hypothetical protein PPACK8108_LOCUS19260 [Phakopsora pachyrhizi]